MKKYDLSILIPARNEEWISRTVTDILEHKRGATEIIIGLDGKLADPGIEDHPDVRIIYYPKSIGQRPMTNQLCRLSSARYVAKTDAHVSFDEGFDVKMLDAFKEVGDNVVMAPTMRNMHVFNWVCKKCKNKWYQGPTPKFCFEDYKAKVKNEKCDNTTDFERDVVWIAKRSPQSTSYRFDKTMHFQYFGEYKKKQEGDLVESMSLQGSFFMCTREKYWELNLGDEAFGGWGSQGSQVACSFWLSGGRVIINKRTWYGHLFRTQGGDFGFPYPLSGREIEQSRERVRDLFLNGKFKGKYPLSWLIEKFKPVPGWHDSLEDKPNNDMEIQEDFPKPENGPKKGIIFYTDNKLNLKIAHSVQDRLRKISKEKNIPIVSCSLKTMNNFGKNIHLPLERGVVTYFKQIVSALEASDADIVYLCEHDVLYSPEHFDFTPPDRDKFYYDHSVWRVRSRDGFAVSWDANQVAEICADRKLLLEFYKERLKQVEGDIEHFNRSYEPGGRDSGKYENWKSSVPSIDIRHDSNLTKSKWSINDFRDKSTCINWQESNIDNIPGWNGDDLRKVLGL